MWCRLTSTLGGSTWYKNIVTNTAVAYVDNQCYFRLNRLNMVIVIQRWTHILFGLNCSWFIAVRSMHQIILESQIFGLLILSVLGQRVEIGPTSDMWGWWRFHAFRCRNGAEVSRMCSMRLLCLHSHMRLKGLLVNLNFLKDLRVLSEVTHP